MIKRSKLSENGANLGIEEKLWAAADKMRGHMDPAEYKHVALGIIFLKYVSDSFAEKYNSLEAAEKEDKDQYVAENIFGFQRRLAEIVLQNSPIHTIVGETKILRRNTKI